MRFSVPALVFLMSVSVFLASSVAYAQMVDHVCERAENTADTMKCHKIRHDKAQNLLKETYDRALELYKVDVGEVAPDSAEKASANKNKQSVSVSAVETLRQSQADWLAYRDRECERQVVQVESESLKRQKALQCNATLTEQRVNMLLAELQQREKKAYPESFEVVPVWMNVLAGDYPDVFWRYGARLSADLNCDEQKEEVIAGLRVEPNGSSVGGLQAILAISDNPLSGRPGVQLLSFPIVAQAEDGGVCSENIKFSVVPLPVARGAGSCSVALRIEDEGCASYTVSSQKGKFKFLSEQNSGS